MDIVRLVLSSSKNSWEGAGSDQGGKRDCGVAVAPWVEVEQKLACYEGISPAPNGASPSWDTFLPAGAAPLPAARSINCNTFLKVSISQVKAAQIYHNHKLWLCGKLLCSHQGSGQGSWGMAAPTHWLEPLR